MDQKLLITVSSKESLNDLSGKKYALLYDGMKKQYFAVSREELFEIQDSKIKELEGIIKKLKEENANFKAQLQEQNKLFENNINQRFKSFLENYQETNGQLIQMVKSLMEDS